MSRSLTGALRAGACMLVACALLAASCLTAACAASGGVAASYDGGQITEAQVADYIAAYRKQMGQEASDDATWASFLASYNLTPELLRASTIKQKVIDAAVRAKAEQEGVSVDETEMQTYLDNIKNNLAFGDDEIYRQTIEQQGQSVEEAEEGYRMLVLREKLLTQVVPVPDASTEQVEDYLRQTYPDGVSTKHIYLFTRAGLDENGSYSKLAEVQSLRSQLVGEGVSKKAFEALVTEHSNEKELIARKGADGYDLDIADRSEGYQTAVASLEKGEVSEVFTDTDGYSFVWIDSVYDLPAADDAHADYGIDAMPDTLRDYFADSAAHVLWQQECQTYLENLYASSNVQIEPMPDDAPYNVDMTLAQDPGDAEESSE